MKLLDLSSIPIRIYHSDVGADHSTVLMPVICHWHQDFRTEPVDAAQPTPLVYGAQNQAKLAGNNS